MQKIILATSNPGKLEEFQDFLSNTDIEIVAQSDMGVSDADETGLSFVENAILKARHASNATGLPALADDSGLVIDALNGEPGIHSARYTGDTRDHQKNIDKVLAKLSNQTPPFTARFYSVLALLRHSHDPTPLICQGIWEGEITLEQRGTEGFGYDPIFYIPSHECTAAELPLKVKNQLSHRAKALQQLLTQLSK